MVDCSPNGFAKQLGKLDLEPGREGGGKEERLNHEADITLELGWQRGLDADTNGVRTERGRGRQQGRGTKEGGDGAGGAMAQVQTFNQTGNCPVVKSIGGPGQNCMHRVVQCAYNGACIPPR
eukprot:12126459-Karenia_brevis.AAC.2